MIIVKCPNPQCGLKMKINPAQLNPNDPRLQCPKCGTISWYRPEEHKAQDKVLPNKAIKHNEKKDLGWLVVHDEEAQTQTYALTTGENLVGRKATDYGSKKIPKIPIITNDRYMSRNHCIIEVKDKGSAKVLFYLKDWDSVNGTFVNCQDIGTLQRLSKKDVVILEDGDTIQMGKTKIVLKTQLTVKTAEDATLIVSQTPL